MIDTEHVKCDTCTAPEPMELDASDEASRGWPTVDIETNPYKAQFPLFQQHPEIAFLDSAATAQRPACVLDAERDFYQRMNANPLRGLYSLSVEATEAIAKVRQQIDYIESPEVVSSDFVGSHRAGIVDGLATIATGDSAVVYVWYDNEYGYSCQVVRIIEQLSGSHPMQLPMRNV